ncbi:MAG: alpha/beta hydrolase [Alphaproteobacteria bacterium]|nr:alpha/beta hydrolase [Alphaproteobacteria bacterium]
MKTAHADILIIPGWSGSEKDHWQSRWQRSLKTARRIEQEEWFEPNLEAWSDRIIKAVEIARRPVVLVAHSLGVITLAHTAPRLPEGKIAGAFFVAPADVDNVQDWPVTRGYEASKSLSGFAPIPTATLPFPSMLVASSNDPYCQLGRAKQLSRVWGAKLIEAGEVGHLNVNSGHGPWPEGLLRFGLFMKELG